MAIYAKSLYKVRYFIKLKSYRHKLPLRVAEIRKKESIKVLFVLSDLSTWKTEYLFQSMVLHPRFLPVIGLSTNKQLPEAKSQLLSYVQSMGYKYIDLDYSKDSIKDINPDLITYHKPYDIYSEGHSFKNNLNFVFWGMGYCFNITKRAVHQSHAMYDYCWQYFVENDEVAQVKKSILGFRGENIKVTGVPMQDILCLPKEKFSDPWKDKTGKKRIIYAPHHSIKGTNGEGIEFATFLDFGETILQLAEKYNDSITIAFKPHPHLYNKLVDIWGKERTDEYYNSWRNLENTQLETGEYVDLFKYSDAIIHDSASFILEYLYMDNPAMYLLSESNSIDDMYDFVQKGFYCYEHGNSVDDIENFIMRVIEGVDIMENKRKEYIRQYLLPPGGKTASENIINSILG
ncbi:MAG: CDP-glycerol glycerophosphotransferase family protein [Bacteroidales bacterium]|nr:CDP-glycerol glycerophosphotransferase family protein [Bacteroidales bacterium]